MKIALYDADNTNFHNLALMKLSAFYKARGEDVSKYIPLLSHTYDRIYASKVFTFKNDITYLPDTTIKGGTGYKEYKNLPDEIEHICPDYELYRSKISLGFLTRGCIRNCSWCIVPKKEGEIHAHADIEEFLRHKQVILMDNNVLAHDHGIAQIEKIVKLSIKVDFNQGLDARLIDKQIAERLAKIKWLSPVRLACDIAPPIKHWTKSLVYIVKTSIVVRNHIEFVYSLVGTSIRKSKCQ